MSFSVHADNADELLVLLDGQAANLHAIEEGCLSVTSVAKRGWFSTAGSFLLCRAPAPTTTKIPFGDVVNARVEGDDVVIDWVDHKKGVLQTVRGAIEQGHLEHAKRWTVKLLKLAYKDVDPSRRYKVIINPFSGTKRARALWEDKLKAVFVASGADLDVTYTERGGHARDIARDLDLTKYDGIICISGDGIVHEVINGLASRPDARRALRMPLGIIPGGTGNALAICIVGPKDVDAPTRSALAIIKGRPLPMDIMSVTQGTKRSYSFLSLSYGLIADCDVGTDHLRWMGDTRFVYEYINGAIAQRKYACELSMRIAEADKEAIFSGAKRKEDARLDHIDVEDPFSPEADQSMPDLRFGTVNDPLDADKWTVWNEPVFSIYTGNVPYMAQILLQFPAARSDGLIDVTFQAPQPRLAALSVLDGSDKGKHLELESLMYRKVEALRLVPKGVVDDSKRKAWLALDGEPIPCEPIQMEAHKGIARVLSDRPDWYLDEYWTKREVKK